MVVRQVGAADVVDLRHEVLRPGRPRETAVWPGDPSARHWAGFEGERIVAVVTVMESPGVDGPRWQLRGMAVAPGMQGAGVGGALLRAVHEAVGAPMWCNARVRAIPFYERHGWRVTSEVFDIPEVGPHRRMVWP